MSRWSYRYGLPLRSADLSTDATNSEAGAATWGQRPRTRPHGRRDGYWLIVAVGKCLLQFRDARVGGLGAAERASPR